MTPRALARSLVSSLRPVAAGAVMALVPVAGAQSIDCQLAARPQLTSADEARVREVTAALLPGVASDDPAASEKARNDLLRPLRCADVSRSFRLNLGAATSTELMRMAASSSDHVAINALRIAGEIATTASTDVLRRGLEDPRAGVRCMAAIGFRDTLRSVAAGNAGIVAASVEPMLEQLARQIESDPDVLVVENLILALDATRNDSAVHLQAMRRLAPALAKRAQTLRAAEDVDHGRWQIVLIRGIDAVTIPMTDAGGGIDAGYRVQAALLAGQAVAYTRARLERDGIAGLDLAGTESESIKTLVNTAERVLLLAEAARGGATPRQTLLPRFEDALRTSEIEGFVTEAARWMGDSGILTRAPYNAKAADFR